MKVCQYPYLLSTNKYQELGKFKRNIAVSNFAEIPTITYPTAGSSSYAEGSLVNISCNAAGQPDPDVKWIHNEQVKSSGRKTAHLIFSPISKADVGTYRCRANNSAGSTEKQLKLEIKCEYVTHGSRMMGS